MKTKAWTSELLFQLCCNNNVSVAFRSFGIADTTTTILIALLDAYDAISRLNRQIADLSRTGMSQRWILLERL